MISCGKDRGSPRTNTKFIIILTIVVRPTKTLYDKIYAWDIQVLEGTLDLARGEARLGNDPGPRGSSPFGPYVLRYIGVQE